MVDLTKESARRFLLYKQHLLPPRRLKGIRGIAAVFDSLRVVQYDPLNPCGRNHDLVLQARVADYRVDAYRAWLYDQRRGVEYYDKELCILPVEDITLCHHSARYHWGHTRLKPFLNEHAADIRKLLRYIRSYGPITSGDVPDTKRRYHQFWNSPTFGRAALDALWKTGKLVIHHRDGARKWYDLPERAYGAGVFQFYRPRKKGTKGTIGVDQILRRLAAVGMLPRSGAGTGWLGFGGAVYTAPVIDALVRKGVLAEVCVQDVRTLFVVRSEDIPIFESRRVHEDVSTSMVFLAPLDNLLWDRKMIRDIFDFDYTWEVYTPEKKRKFGYYVLPILFGDRLVGRIEPVVNSRGILEIRGLWAEPGFAWTRANRALLNEAVKEFQTYVHSRQEPTTQS